MYSNCLNNNYEVYGICNIKDFTRKNGPFNCEAWTQFSISEVINISKNNPPIEAIQKIYANVIITSTKIINTPKNYIENSEGMKLTGKKILIDGYVCERIIYTSLKKTQDIHTAFFNIPFCTHIVLESNAYFYNYKNYCIKTCLEDVWVKSFDCKNIFQNIVLFIVVKKISNKNCPNEDCNKISNTIVLKASNNEEIGNIEFKLNTGILCLNSTGININMLSNIEYFSFLLKDSDNKIKARQSIKGGENADKLSEFLNNVTFEVGDIVSLKYFDKNLIEVPNKLLKDTRSDFKLGICGFEEFDIQMLKETIQFKGSNGEIIANVQFNLTENILELESMHIEAKMNFKAQGEANFIYESLNSKYIDELEAGEYFSLKLKDSNENIKVKAVVRLNENADNFAEFLNGKNFQVGDVIEINYLEDKKVVLKDYPSIGEEFEMTGGNFSLKINSTALVPYKATLKDSVIILKGENNNKIISIRFDPMESSAKFNIQTTGEKVSLGLSNEEYFLLLDNGNDATNLRSMAVIKENENGESFKNSLNGKVINYGDIITLKFKDNTKVELWNFNNMKKYIPDGESIILSIDNQGVKKAINNLPEVLTITDGENKSIAFFQYNINSQSLFIQKTEKVFKGIPANEQRVEIFFSVKDNSGYFRNRVLEDGVNIDKFIREVGANINLKDNEGRIFLVFYDPNNVTLRNFNGVKEYHPNRYFEMFSFSNNKLKSNPFNMLKNVIILKNGLSEVSKNSCLLIAFNTDNKTLYIHPRGQTTGGNTSEYFRIILKDSKGMEKFNEVLPSDRTSYKIFNAIKGKESFEYSDILVLRCDQVNKILIVDFEGEIFYKVSTNEIQLKITEIGLVRI